MPVAVNGVPIKYQERRNSYDRKKSFAVALEFRRHPGRGGR
jgi:hypothetical protein